MDREGDLRDYNLGILHYWGVGLCMQWSAHNGDFVNYICKKVMLTRTCFQQDHFPLNL